MTTEITMHHATKAKLERLQDLLAAEYPALSITPVGNEINKLDHFVTHHREDEDANVVEVMTTKKVPELADIFAACEDADLDPEAMEADEEEGPTGSVVDTAYKSQYREQSTTGTTCGDWLAEWLTAETTIATGKGKATAIDIETLHLVFSNNGLDLTAKWALSYENPAKQSRGWTGRYRMSGRIALEKAVAKAGEVLDAAGKATKVPAEDLAILRTKHAKWLEKEVKRDAAAEELAEI